MIRLWEDPKTPSTGTIVHETEGPFTATIGLGTTVIDVSLNGTLYFAHDADASNPGWALNRCIDRIKNHTARKIRLNVSALRLIDSTSQVVLAEACLRLRESGREIQVTGMDQPMLVPVLHSAVALIEGTAGMEEGSAVAYDSKEGHFRTSIRIDGRFVIWSWIGRLSDCSESDESDPHRLLSAAEQKLPRTGRRDCIIDLSEICFDRSVRRLLEDVMTRIGPATVRLVRPRRIEDVSLRLWLELRYECHNTVDEAMNGPDYPTAA